MAGDRAFFHSFIQEKGEIENSKTMEALRFMSRYRTKYKKKIDFSAKRDSMYAKKSTTKNARG